MVFRPAPPKWAWLLDTAAFPAAELSPVEQIFQPIPRRQSQTRAPPFFFPFMVPRSWLLVLLEHVIYLSIRQHLPSPPSPHKRLLLPPPLYLFHRRLSLFIPCRRDRCRADSSESLLGLLPFD